MTWPSKRTWMFIGGGLAACVLCFFLGRWSVKPVEITTTATAKSDVQIVYASHGQGEKVDKGRTRTVRVVTKKPTGEIQSTTTTEHAADLTLHWGWDQTGTSNVRTETQTVTVTRSLQPDWRVGVGVLTPLDSFKLRYLIEGDRRLIGPFSLGARGVLAPDDWRKSQAGVVLSLTR